MARPTGRLLAAVVVAATLAGCLTLTAARVPDPYLTRGWQEDAARSDDEPSKEGLGRRQALAYKDAGDGPGYGGSLTVVTIRTLVAMSEETILEALRQNLEDHASAQDIRLENEIEDGSRALANGATSRYVVYTGEVAKSSLLFKQAARTKLLGEVFRCDAERTVVVAAAIAQVTDVRSVGGVPLPRDDEPQTWHEIVADPAGTVEDVVGGDGLAYRIACSGG